MGLNNMAYQKGECRGHRKTDRAAAGFHKGKEVGGQRWWLFPFPMAATKQPDVAREQTKAAKVLEDNGFMAYNRNGQL